jgi:ABC-type Mn2+/Zn2+ transport system ATPase subunit
VFLRKRYLLFGIN